ncbi:hepatitis A virus cellular receptor 1-like [Penaeus vannamei]|uniref:hepatitis A virus cellular receptor 1-like n=1 Tax=Penaeus vannamei TaxID=6689 RepID=UPI00387F7CBE
MRLAPSSNNPTGSPTPGSPLTMTPNTETTTHSSMPTTPYSGNTLLFQQCLQKHVGRVTFRTRSDRSRLTNASSVPNLVITDQTALHKHAHVLTAAAPIMYFIEAVPLTNVPTASPISTYFPTSTTSTSTFDLPQSNSFATLNPDNPVSTTAPTPSPLPPRTTCKTMEDIQSYMLETQNSTTYALSTLEVIADIYNPFPHQQTYPSSTFQHYSR